MDIFSQRLKWLREKSGLTQKQVADKLGISQQYYGRFEKGTGQPNLETLVKIRKLFNESLDFLLGVTDFDKHAEILHSFFIKTSTEYESTFNYLTGLMTDSSIRATMGDRYSDYMNEATARLTVTRENMQSAHKDLIAYLQKIPGVKNTTFDQIKMPLS